MNARAPICEVSAQPGTCAAESCAAQLKQERRGSASTGQWRKEGLDLLNPDYSSADLAEEVTRLICP